MQCFLVPGLDEGVHTVLEVGSVEAVCFDLPKTVIAGSKVEHQIPSRAKYTLPYLHILFVDITPSADDAGCVVDPFEVAGPTFGKKTDWKLPHVALFNAEVHWAVVCVGAEAVCRDGIAHQVEQRHGALSVGVDCCDGGDQKKCKDGGNLGRLHDAYINSVSRWLILCILLVDKRLDRLILVYHKEGIMLFTWLCTLKASLKSKP